MKRIAIVMSVLGVAALASACSSSDDTGSSTSSSSSSGSSGSSSGSSGSSGGTTLPASLSASFTSECARCHGPAAEGMGTYPKLPGDVTSAAAYIAQVRAGKNLMPAFTANQISDADLTSDYTYLTEVRK